MRWLLRIIVIVLAAAFAFGHDVGRASGRPGAGDGLKPVLPKANIVIPVQGVQASQLKPTFNQARVGHVHHALDILAPRGTPVIAAVDGTIRKLFFSGAGGITIYEFDRDATLVYYYAHLDRYADDLREGMRVRQGDVIGYVGTTGNASPDAPHLHFAVELLPPTKEWWKGTPVNPYPLLAKQSDE